MEQKSPSRFLVMLALVLSGEAIFFIPFILPRVFRPTVLEVFSINNFELGSMFSAYGIVALLSYFFGGPLADRFPARNLMATALVATSFGGIIMAFIPSFKVLTVLYAFWGATTILLFWAALIRATREWGGDTMQGRAFGILDAGRGLTAALISTGGVALLANLMPADVASASAKEQMDSFRWVILMFSGFTFLIAILVWFSLPGHKLNSAASVVRDLKGIKKIASMPAVWLQAVIIICAYVGYKITDDFSLYAKDVLDFDEVQAAGVGTFALWLRPVGAVIAGFLADRFLASRLLIWSFSLVAICGIIISSGFLDPGIILPYILSLIFLSLGIYALRALYYAIMDEAHIPLALTGTAVGVVSVVGYTPDIFVGPLMGWLLDRSPGAEGHQNLFMVLAVFGFAGLLASLAFRRVSGKSY